MLAVTLLAAWITLTAVVCWLAPGRVLAGPGITTSTVVSGPASTYRGHTASEWAQKFRGMRTLAYHRELARRRVKRIVLQRPSVGEAIKLAAATYGNGGLLWSLARCESQLNPRAQNPSGSTGLLQFMPSTFASTPYRNLSIWSPYANAMAGGWMLQQGRRNEWVC